MTKFRRMLGYLAIVSTIIGAGLLAYAFLTGPEVSKQDNVVLIVTLSLWILPSLFAAVWFLTEKLIITNDKIEIRTLFCKKSIAKQNFKKIRILYGDVSFRNSVKVCVIPHDVPDVVVEGKGYSNYELLARKDKRIIRFPLDSVNEHLLKKYGWKE